MVIPKEPVVREADQARGTSTLVVDVGVRGVWQPQTEALLDPCVIDTNIQFHANSYVNVVLASYTREGNEISSSSIDLPCIIFPICVVCGWSRGM